ETGEIIKLADTLEALCTTFYELKRGNVVIAKAHKKFIEWFESETGRALLQKYPLAQEMYASNKFDPNYLTPKIPNLVALGELHKTVQESLNKPISPELVEDIANSPDPDEESA